MDPITAAIQLVTAAINMHVKTLEGMSVAQREAYGKMVLEDLKRWHDFLDFFRPKEAKP